MTWCAAVARHKTAQTKENAFHFYGQYFGCISILQLAFPIAYDSRSWKSNEMCRAQLKTSTLFRYIGSVEKTVSQLPVSDKHVVASKVLVIFLSFCYKHLLEKENQ